MEYAAELEKMAGRRVKLVGPVYGEGYKELSVHCGIFVLPGIVEATRLVLLDQMGFGSAILYHDCAATREVIGKAGMPFGPVNAETSLAEKLNELIGDPGKREAGGRKAGGGDHEAVFGGVSKKSEGRNEVVSRRG